MRQLMLIRHGITDWNISGRYQGHSDVPLSQQGIEQAQALARYLQGSKTKVDFIYSSPLKRALETAKIVYPNQDITPDSRLKELNFGEFEGATQAENERHAAWDSWFANPFERRAPGGESYAELMARAAQWLTTLPKDANSVAFAHAGTIRMLISHILGLEKPPWRKRIYLTHTGMTRILFKEDEAIIERVNDTRHLTPNGLDPFSD